jgi:immune inhibitor A
MPLDPGKRKKSSKRKMHAIALLVDFSDNQGRRSVKHFQKLLFDKANQNSMTNFYRQLSYDALTIFCQNDNLVRFDTDKDGFVDAAFLIQAGAGAEVEPNPTKRKNLIWSHTWTLPEPFVNHGVKVFDYSAEPEDGRVGIFSHEFGQLLGLPDLYDRTYRSHGVGDWCLMAGGSWGGEGDRPARMSCWVPLKTRLDQTQGSYRKKVAATQHAGEKKTGCYRLWTKGAIGSEYFLLENRQAKGLDAALPGSGLAVWHIDERQSSDDNPLGYLVALLQADGNKDLELLRNSGNGGDLFPGDKPMVALDDNTTPSTRSPSHVAHTNIGMRRGVVALHAEV